MTNPEQTLDSSASPQHQLAALIRERFQAAGYLREQDLPKLEADLISGDLSVEQWLLLTENALEAQASQQPPCGQEE